MLVARPQYGIRKLAVCWLKVGQLRLGAAFVRASGGW